MPRSGYVAEIRRHVGDRLLVLPSVSICIFDDDGRILLVRHDNYDVWATPGGTVEPDEAPARAAIREAREELGVEVAPRDLIGVFGGPDYEVVYPNGDRVIYMTAAFHCEIIAGRGRGQRAPLRLGDRLAGPPHPVVAGGLPPAGVRLETRRTAARSLRPSPG